MRLPKGMSKLFYFLVWTVFHFVFSTTEDKALKAKSEIETSSHEKIQGEVHLFNFNFSLIVFHPLLRTLISAPTEYSVLYQICALKSLTH